jgi:hypothetical protein
MKSPGRSSNLSVQTKYPESEKNKRRVSSAERLEFLEPMYARPIQQLPKGVEWSYEVKFDATGP